MIWLVGGVLAMSVAFGMGQIASSFPTAGGLYHWSSHLGGKVLGLGNCLVQPGGFDLRGVLGGCVAVRESSFKGILLTDTLRWILPRGVTGTSSFLWRSF